MTEVDLENTAGTFVDLPAVAELVQMTLERGQGVSGQCLGRLLTDHQVFIQVSHAADAAVLNQAQQQVKLECVSTGFAVPTKVNDILPANQPVPRHQVRAAAQQVQVTARTHDTEQATITVTLNFIGTDGLARLRPGQLYLQAQQTTWNQHIASLHQHHPLTGQLAHDLVEMGNQVGLGDLDEMQGILGRGNGRQVAGLEHHHLEVAQTAAYQAVESALQRGIAVVQIEDDERHLWRWRLVQVVEDAIACNSIGGGRGNGLQHFARRRVSQQRGNRYRLHSLKLFAPNRQVPRLSQLLHTQGAHQALTHLHIEHTQFESLPVAGLEAIGTVVGMHSQQCLLTYPGTFQRAALHLAGRPGVNQKLDRTQLTEHSGVVVRHLDELFRLERQLRLGRHAVPARSQQQRRFTALVRVAYERIEHFEALGIGKHRGLSAIPLLDLANDVGQMLFATG
ncbi:hypothetical protein D3C78_735340 [compost metagenome]